VSIPGEIWQRLPLIEIALGAGFFLIALTAIVVTRAAGGVAVIWPANAIAAACLIRLPRVRWISAGVALFLAGIASDCLGGHDSVEFAATLTAVNLLEIAAMVWTYRIWIRFPYPNLSISQAAHMTLVLGLAIPGLAAVIGGFIVHVRMDSPAAQSIARWWAADAIGACLFAPAIILFSPKALQRLLQQRFLALNVATLLICIFSCFLAIRYVRFPFVVFCLPLMIAAFRVGGFGASILGLCSGLTIIGLWLHGVRPVGLESGQSVSAYVGLPILALLASVMPPTAVGLGTDARRESLQALRFSERRFRESMERSPIGMVMGDLDGVWTYTNAALQNMLGYTHQELQALPLGGPASPDDSHEIDGRWQKLRANRIDFYEVNRRFLHKNGSLIWVHCVISLVKAEDGTPLHFIGQIESLEARRHAEATLAKERERLEITLGTIADGVITADIHTRITYLNGAAGGILRQTFADIGNRRLDEIIILTDPDTARSVPNIVSQSILHGKVFRRTTPNVLHRPDGTECYVTDVAAPIIDASGQVSGIVLVLHDASADFERARDLSHRASHDVLTGLANRAEFERRLKEVFAQSGLLDVPAAVLMIDLDRFKAVNDSGGHAAGDAALRAVAAVLSSIFRHSDTVARLGGDEFGVILPNCPRDRSAVVGQQLLRALNPLTIAWETSSYTIGASVGIAMKAPEFTSAVDWLAAADGAAYQAKHEGRGQVCFAAPGKPAV
jgi:diguanylate cyclase (GGDEF)-like protein/PAS domain S-box-containing protein